VQVIKRLYFGCKVLGVDRSKILFPFFDKIHVSRNAVVVSLFLLLVIVVADLFEIVDILLVLLVVDFEVVEVFESVDHDC